MTWWQSSETAGGLIKRNSADTIPVFISSSDALLDLNFIRMLVILVDVERRDIVSSLDGLPCSVGVIDRYAGDENLSRHLPDKCGHVDLEFGPEPIDDVGATGAFGDADGCLWREGESPSGG